MNLRTLIIDDEAPARALIRAYLEQDPDIEIAGEFQNGYEGLKGINQLQPDLVILDIQMPKITGFELLELLDHHPIIIFSTAYDEFAIKAFELNAVDYLLKPYSKARFQEAVQKAKEKKAHADPESLAKQNFAIIQHQEQRDELIKRVVIKVGSKIHIVTVDQIRYLEAQDDYVNIFTREGKLLKQKTMKFFEDHLDPNEFVRIHRSYIVKISEIERLELLGKESHILRLKNGEKLKVSRSGYPRLKEVLNF